MKPEIRHILATKGTAKQRSDFVEEAIRHFHQKDLPASVRASLIGKEVQRLRMELAGNESYIQELEEEAATLKTRLKKLEIELSNANNTLNQLRQSKAQPATPAQPVAAQSQKFNLTRLPKMTSQERLQVRRDLRVQELERLIEKMNSENGLTGLGQAKIKKLTRMNRQLVEVLIRNGLTFNPDLINYEEPEEAKHSS